MLSVKYKATVYPTQITGPEHTAQIFRSIWKKSRFNIQEQVYILFLNNSNQIIGCDCLNTGKCDEVIFDVKTMMAMAIGCLACKVIVAHNHPSGFLKPSEKDIFYTNRLYTALNFVDITLVDHIILNQHGYFSFRENGVKMELLVK
jgi:DNA repair protein RadC